MILTVLKSILVFILAGLCEIGGGYLVWQWMKEGKPFSYGLLGCIILARIVAYSVLMGRRCVPDPRAKEMLRLTAS